MCVCCVALGIQCCVVVFAVDVCIFVILERVVCSPLSVRYHTIEMITVFYDFLIFYIKYEQLI